MGIKTNIKSTPETASAVVEREFRAGEKPVVIITGSTGLIGARLAEALSANYEVIGLDVKRPEKWYRTNKLTKESASDANAR